jgi:hypothetical protein
MEPTSRRKFLTDILRVGAVAGTVPLAALSACREADFSGAREPEFRFLQVNDLHVQGNHLSRTKVGATYTGANTRAGWLRQALRNGSGVLPPVDFILLNGDMVHGESLEAIKYDLDYFHANFLRDLPVPVYPVIGNHENLQREGDARYQAPFCELFGSRAVDYSFRHKGLEFIVLNNTGTWVTKDTQLIEYRLKTFEAMLNARPGVPKIICCHIPLVPVREKEVLLESFGYYSFSVQESEMRRLVREHSDVLAVTSGHLHLSGLAVRGNTYHIAVAGLASYPHDMALFSVFTDRIDVELIRVPSSLLVPSTNIHGVHRHGKEFTDATHADCTSYVMGLDRERKFSIPRGWIRRLVGRSA